MTQVERVETSRRRLMAAAAELIVEKGWEATTAAEIGRRAGYSRTMVHARYGGKDAILDDFMQAYMSRLNPDPDPAATGMEQVLAHIDRIRELYARDPEVFRAMYVATFEAVKTTSPLRDRIAADLSSAALKIAASLRLGISDKSVRRDVDVDAAVGDITAATFGAVFVWIALPGSIDIGRELARTRERIIHDYGPRTKPA